MEEFSYYSKTKGIGGSIKNSPEDFLVEEIQEDGLILEIGKKISETSGFFGTQLFAKRNTDVKKCEGEFTHFILEKENYTSAKAIREIGRRLNIGKKRFSYAGTKDRAAITTQLCSVYQIDPQRLLNLKIKDIRINGAWIGEDKVRLGQLVGNRFKIKVKDCDSKNVQKIYEELNGKFPNYFGEQRFGSNRKNTHKVGELILKNRIKDAVMNYLCETKGENNKEAIEARKKLKGEQDFKDAINYFPKYLIHERTILDYLAKHETQYMNALRKLPRQILLLFIHAFQSYLFNLNLSERIEEGNIEKEEGEHYCGINEFGFPQIDIEGEDYLCVKIIGYESKINKREKDLLERFQIHQDDFKLRSFPELASRGTFRTFFSPIKDFKFKDEVFEFSLQTGSYATSALREFIKK